MQKEEVLHDKKDEKAVLGEKIEKLNFSFHENDTNYEADFKLADCDQNTKLRILNLQKEEVLRDKKDEKSVVGEKIEKFNFSFHKNDNNNEEDYKIADCD